MLVPGDTPTDPLDRTVLSVPNITDFPPSATKFIKFAPNVRLPLLLLLPPDEGSEDVTPSLGFDVTDSAPDPDALGTNVTPSLGFDVTDSPPGTDALGTNVEPSLGFDVTDSDPDTGALVEDDGD